MSKCKRDVGEHEGCGGERVTRREERQIGNSTV